MNKTLLIVICDFLLLSMLGMISFDDLPTKPESSDDLLVAPYASSQLVDLLKMSLDKERENRQDLSSQVDEYSSRAKEIEDISKAQAEELKKRQEDLALSEKEKQDALKLAEQERLAKEALALEKTQSLENTQNLELKLAQERQAKLSLEAEKAKTLENAKALESKLQGESLEKQALQKEFIVSETKLKDSAVKKQELEEKLGQLSESDALLKARLATMQAELDLAKSNAELLEKDKLNLQNQSKELSTQLEVAKTQANIYQEDLQKAQVLVWQEKSEKQQIQEHANTLAKGVDKLADSQSQIVDSQEKLSKQVEDMRPLSPSEIYENYKSNALIVEIKTQRGSLIGDGITVKKFNSAVVDIDGVYWAFMSAKDTLFDRAVDKFYAPDILEITPKAKGVAFGLSTLFYVKGYTNLLAFRVPDAFVEKSKIKPYKLAANPFKYTEATIINPSKLYYGQLKYGIDEKYSGIANVDAGFFNAIFGDFSPSTGDLVFDRAGNFLGLMTSSSMIALSRNFNASTASLSLLDKYNKAAAKDFLAAMKSIR